MVRLLPLSCPRPSRNYCQGVTGTWWDTGVTRRGALTLGAAAAATAGVAGCSGSAFDGPDATLATARRAGRSGARVRFRDWERLARTVDGTLARPGERAYGRVRLLENPAFDGARPLAVLSVDSTADVVTGLSFARDHDLPVALRSGGHAIPAGRPATTASSSTYARCRRSACRRPATGPAPRSAPARPWPRSTRAGPGRARAGRRLLRHRRRRGPDAGRRGRDRQPCLRSDV